MVPPESSSAVLVMTCSKSVSLCNRFRARLVDSSRNRTFSRGYTHYPNLMRLYGGLLEPRGSNLTPLKSTFNAEHFICRCQVVLVYLEWFRRNSLLKCVLQPEIAKKLLKPLFWGSRSFKVIDVGTTGKLLARLFQAVLVMMSSKSVSICNRSHARRAYSGKITISKGGTAL